MGKSYQGRFPLVLGGVEISSGERAGSVQSMQRQRRYQ